MFMLRMFNGFALTSRRQAEETACTLTAQTTQLLAFLALGRGKQFSRAELARALSREGEPDLGHGALNTKLWRLRKELDGHARPLGECLSSGRDKSVGLNGPGPLWIDTHEFCQRAWAVLGKPLHQLTLADTQELRAVAALYTGELLAGNTETWVLRERERLRRLYLNVLGRLMQVLSAGQNYEAAIGCAQAILEADPLREDVHRELMRFFVLNGQRAAALQQFERCRSQLRAELAIHPMRETVALYQQIAEAALTPEAQSVKASLVALELPADYRGGDSAYHVETARQLLAQADSHLQLCLQLHQ